MAGELGLLDRQVFFHSDWVPYEARVNWLLDADCAISTHVEHLETRFAFRTRLLDCFWTGLPVVCTRGDSLGDLVEREGAGAAVPQRDATAAAVALEHVLERGRAAYAPAIERIAADFAWHRVVQPLVEFARLGRPARGGRAARARHRPVQLLRSVGYRAGRSTLNAVGLTDWPTLG